MRKTENDTWFLAYYRYILRPKKLVLSERMCLMSDAKLLRNWQNFLCSHNVANDISEKIIHIFRVLKCWYIKKTTTICHCFGNNKENEIKIRFNQFKLEVFQLSLFWKLNHGSQNLLLFINYLFSLKASFKYELMNLKITDDNKT